MSRLFQLLIVLFFVSSLAASAQGIYKINTSKIKFNSDAPLEVISAQSSTVSGYLDTRKRIFSFSIPVESFQGFNSALQLQHFREHYMQIAKYPTSSFTGKLLESFDLTKNGTYIIRAKGILTIHGVPQERVIKSKIVVNNGIAYLNSQFTVVLADHNISIPKIAAMRLAEVITVNFKASLK